MKSKRTKKFQFGAIFTQVLSILCLLAPIAVALAYGYAETGAIGALGLSGSMIVALIMIILSFVFKWNLHSWIWILLIAIGAALDNFYPFLVAIGCCSAAEELILRPIHASFKAKYIANNEIDKRG